MVDTAIAAPDILDNTGTTAALAFSAGPSGAASLSSAVDTFRDHDWVAVRLRAGELYRFSVDTPVSYLDATLALRDAAGTVLAANDNGSAGLDPSDPLLTFRPAQTGTFFLDIGGNGFRPAGSYTAQAQEVPADRTTFSSVAPNEAIRGDIQDPSDHDWYKVSLEAGQRYTFDAIGNGPGNTLLDPTLALRDVLGRQIAFNDDFGGSRNARIDFTAPNTGTYFLDVGTFGGHTGSYVLIA